MANINFKPEIITGLSDGVDSTKSPMFTHSTRASYRQTGGNAISISFTTNSREKNCDH